MRPLFLLLSLLFLLPSCSAEKAAPVEVGPNAATLSITSEPVGATLVLDGKAIGPTPQNLQVRPGQHNLVIHKSGFFTVTEKLFLGPKRSVKKHITLVGSH